MKNIKHQRYEIGEWKRSDINGWWATLYVGGNFQNTEMICRKFCFPKGLCVTIEKTKYVFGGGVEDGIKIGFIQYPPFPEPIENILEKMIKIGKKIAEGSFQFSFSIVTSNNNIFFSRRADKK